MEGFAKRMEQQNLCSLMEFAFVGSFCFAFHCLLCYVTF